MNSLIIFADVKLTNLEKQGADGGRRSEERCIVLIDTDQTLTADVKMKKKEWNRKWKKITFSFLFSFIVIVIIVFLYFNHYYYYYHFAYHHYDN